MKFPRKLRFEHFADRQEDVDVSHFLSVQFLSLACGVLIVAERRACAPF